MTKRDLLDLWSVEYLESTYRSKKKVRGRNWKT